MKVLILGAGYGTRLLKDLESELGKDYCHLLGCPKPLLPIGDKPLVSHWLEILNKEPVIDEIYILTNEVSHPHFTKLLEDWPNVKLFSDGSTCNEGRLGAIGGIELIVKQFNIEDHLLVIAGDTLFYDDFRLKEFIEAFEERQIVDPRSSLVVYVNCPDEVVHKYGILETDDGGKVINFLEKPQPTATLSRKQCPCFYLLSNHSLPLLSQFLLEKKDEPLKNRDATGNFISYLYTRLPLYTLPLTGRFDVGGLESYKICNEYFSKKSQ